MGYSLNTVDETELNAVADMLIALKPKLFAIISDVEPPLRNRDTSRPSPGPATASRSGTTPDRPVHRGQRRRRAVGGRRIAADAPHKDAAYAFLDYILQPETAAADTVFSLFPHANPAGAAAAGGQRQPGHLSARRMLESSRRASTPTYNSPSWPNLGAHQVVFLSR